MLMSQTLQTTKHPAMDKHVDADPRDIFVPATHGSQHHKRVLQYPWPAIPHRVLYLHKQKPAAHSWLAPVPR